MRIFHRKKEINALVSPPFLVDVTVNSNGLRIFQVYDKEGNPIVIQWDTAQDEMSDKSVSAQAGMQGAEGEAESNRITRWSRHGGIYFPENVPGGQFDSNIKMRAIDSLRRAGSLVPTDMTFEKIESPRTIPLTGSANLSTDQSGKAEMSGIINMSSNAVIKARVPLIGDNCPHCGALIEFPSEKCPKCGKDIKYDNLKPSSQ